MGQPVSFHNLKRVIKEHPVATQVIFEQSAMPLDDSVLERVMIMNEFDWYTII